MSDLLARFGLRRWINAAGTLSRLGGAVASADVAQAMAEAARLSFDAWELQAAASRRLAAATGAEAGLVTTGASAALTLAAAAVIARDDIALMGRLPDASGRPREIVVPRTHRNAYDRALATAGAILVDVGVDDRGTGAGIRGLEAWEVEAAIGPATVAIAASGSAACADDLPILTEVAHRRGLPLIVDAAAQLPPAGNLRRFVDLGADLVCFSGGKAIGGPQGSGLLVGRRPLIASAALQMLDMDVHPSRFRAPPEFFANAAPAAIPRHGIGRGFKASKDAVIGVMVALDAFLASDQRERAASVRQRLIQIAGGLGAHDGLSADIQDAAGPGRLPRLVLRIDATRAGFDARALAERLAAGDPPVALAEGDLAEGNLVIDLTCVAPGDDAILTARLLEAIADRRV